MQIDLNITNNQANHIITQANDLHSARAALLSYQNELQNHWRGEEMHYINSAIDDFVASLAAAASELGAIAADITRAAQVVKRHEK